MKILWAKTDFLHPPTRGGRIRTLETLRRLHQRHEIHYVAYDDPRFPEGPARSSEYSSAAYPVRFPIAPRHSPRFLLDLAKGLFAPLPMALGRYNSEAMRRQIDQLLASQSFDVVVCDFLMLAPNFRDLSGCVLFEHNVETMIWRRHAEHAPDPVRRWFFRLQADRMFGWEGRYCREAGHVIVVSEADARVLRELFDIERVTAVPTGVDLEYFARPPNSDPAADLVFLGSMDWMPNIDAVLYFVQEVLPLIRRRKPDCSLAVVGRSPSPAIRALPERDPLITVTGTVPDVRPYLWGSSVSIVPLRIGGGTRLKVYESMAAGIPVVSTTVGAEGLEIHPPEDIRIADSPGEFAEACLELMDPEIGAKVASAGLEMVTQRFGWDEVARSFESILMTAAAQMKLPAGARR